MAWGIVWAEKTTLSTRVTLGQFSALTLFSKSGKILIDVGRGQRIVRFVGYLASFGNSFQRRDNMKKLMTFGFALVLAMSAAAVAQDSMKQDTMKSDSSMKATTSVTGKISEDGKSFVGDKDGKTWTISNPDAVKGHEGHHVTLKAQADASKGEVKVVSLKMAKDTMKEGTMAK
ncbi:MAG TPA: hypothetical protein VNZ03_06025 [Terriglobales bacterium]|nr:hypothetical protein [Terriglobales bacterium]